MRQRQGNPDASPSAAFSGAQRCSLDRAPRRAFVVRAVGERHGAEPEPFCKRTIAISAGAVIEGQGPRTLPCGTVAGAVNHRPGSPLTRMPKVMPLPPHGNRGRCPKPQRLPKVRSGPRPSRNSGGRSAIRRRTGPASDSTKPGSSRSAMIDESVLFASRCRRSARLSP